MAELAEWLSLSFELKELKKFENLDNEKKQIVFYSENQNSMIIFESLINELINRYNVSICYVTSSKEESNSNFILEQDITNFDSFSQSDIMISDWSGVALEFAFTFERPVLYIDVPKKMHNPDFTDIPYIPIEESIRDKIGDIISPSDIKHIPEKIDELCKKSDAMREQIKKIRDNTIFNIGKSSKIGVKQIIKLLNQLKTNIFRTN